MTPSERLDALLQLRRRGWISGDDVPLLTRAADLRALGAGNPDKPSRLDNEYLNLLADLELRTRMHYLEGINQ